MNEKEELIPIPFIKRSFLAWTVLAACVLALASLASASKGFYVGANRTADGSVILGGFGDEQSGHWLEIVPAQEYGPDATTTVGLTDEANLPGEPIEIPQVEETNRYITSNYSNFVGFPPPLTNGGLNEHQVAIRDIAWPGRESLVEMTETPNQGLNYSDLARVAMERAETAEEAARLMGDLIDEYGYATYYYGGNTHLIADENEGWVVLELAGGEGLWMAERIGPDEIRSSWGPNYISPIPRDLIDFDALELKENDDFLASDNFISFAVEQGWYDPESGEPFDIYGVYSIYDSGEHFAEDYAALQPPVDRLRDLEDGVTVADMMATVRDPVMSSDSSGYGQVAHLRDDLPHPEIATLWVAPTGSVTAPFLPWRIGVQEVPPEYGKHRYLYRDSDASYLNPAYQNQEGTQFAGRLYKRLMYHTCAHPDRFYPEINETLTQFERNMIEEQPSVEATAQALYEAGETQAARNHLTLYSQTQAAEAMDLGNALVDSVEKRTEIFYGITEPEGADINGGGVVSCRQ